DGNQERPGRSVPPPGGGPQKTHRERREVASPSLAFRNVSVCCDRETSEEFTTRVPNTEALCLQPSVFARTKVADRASASLSHAPWERPWCVTASSGGCAKQYAFTWIN